jgi:3',5'-cyclic AMP phosphodiesterase CpdA
MRVRRSREDLAGRAPHVSWALLTDLHVSADPEFETDGFFPSRNTQRVFAEVLAARPDAALILGDLAYQNGQSADYREVRRLLAPLSDTIPVFLTLGNHDDRENYWRCFQNGRKEASAPCPQRLRVVVDDGPVRAVLLDSLFRTGVVPGTLGPEQLDWLRLFLAGHGDKPAVLCVHHPFHNGENQLTDAAELLDLSIRQPHVKAIFHGHSHAYGHEVLEGVHIIGLPAVGMPLLPGRRLGWVSAAFEPAGAELRFHALDAPPAGSPEVLRLRWRP